ncbi:hypothetical protein HK101_010371 [Irineochytrium annulatum]|nr:hypothetical protein HK101_010371 [Irineochytrium annulatum]
MEASYAFLIFAAKTPRDSLIYANNPGILVNSWSSAIKATSVPGAGANASFVAVQRDAVMNRNIYLIGKFLGSCGSTYCAYGASVVIDGTQINSSASTSLVTLFTFPSNTVVTGMTFHANGVDLFVFGTEIWRSSDRGNNWMKAYQLQSQSSSDVFRSFRSSKSHQLLCLQTTLNRVFYGSSASLNMAEITNYIGFGSGDIGEVLVDDVGNTIAIKLWTAGQLKAATNLLPSLADGMLPGTSVVPTDSLIATADDSFDASLVPIFSGGGIVQFYVYKPSGGAFSDFHVGHNITLDVGGHAIIQAVSADGLLATASIGRDFIADSASPAIQQSLSFSPNLIRSVVSGLSLQPVNLTLSSSTGASGWQYSDIGKSITALGGSYLILNIVDPVTATALVVKAPTVLGIAPSGKWSMFDFRSFKERATTASQSVTFSSFVNGVADVTVASGSFAFDPSCKVRPHFFR